MKRRRSMSPSRSPKPSRSPRGTRASTRSPRSPNSPFARGSDPDQDRSRMDPDEESLASARRSSRTKKPQDLNDSNFEEHHSPDRSMNGGGANGSDLPARRTRSSDGFVPSNRRNSSPILPGKYLTSPSHHSPPKQNGRIVDHDSEEEGGGDSRKTRRGQSEPYYNHVRFSPSAKLSSPARYREGRSRRKAADDALHKVRLQNVPSEDEQTEFNRRYSRDLQKRRNRNLRGDKDETEEEEKEKSPPRNRRLHKNESSVDRSSSSTRRKHEEEEHLTPLSLSLRRRSTRATVDHHEEADHESESDVNGDDLGETPKSETRRRAPAREAARNLRYDDHVPETSEDDAKDRRRNGKRNSSKVHESSSAPASLNSTQNNVEMSDEEEDASALNSGQIRRSSRISTKKEVARARETSDAQTEDSSEESSDSSEESDVEVEKKKSSSSRRDGRPKRKRAPVERLSYENPQVRQRRHREEHYSSEEEESIRGKKDRVVRRESAKARIRRKSRPRPANMRDSSLSSSSDTSSDEERFKKRKNKRMMIELSKLRPMNMDKKDVTKAIFRDRAKIGSSCADVTPMEVDLNTTFKNVGGRAEHINCLKEVVVLPLLYPEIFAKFNITPPRGVLFHGPPGTGKTLLARALAAECSHEGRKVAFFMRKGADVLNKWIGESERQLRLLFDQAYVMRPSIIFFDEIDGLAPVRSSRQDQIHSSIVSTLLALIDGLDNRGEVIVIGATNRVENIDPALRRPGRFDRELRFDLPTRDARREILQVHTKSWKPAIPTRLLDILADKSIGYSGADLKGLCAESVLRALRRRYPQVYTTNQKLGLDTEQVVVVEEDFVNAMTVMVPSTLRVNDQHQMPLPTNVKPLLVNTVTSICQMVDKKQHLSFQPRVLISGFPYQSLSTYIGPAILHHLEKLPKHILDLPSLYSNSARSPEENLCQIFHEARRTVPCVLYIPRLKELYMSDSLRMAFHSLLASVQPTAPLLVLAIAEYNDSAEEPALDSYFKQIFSEDEIYKVTEPTEEERGRFYEPVFEAALALPIKEAEPDEVTTIDELEVVPLPESRELTENEEKRLRKKEDALLRELRIFLRDIWHKINREKGFFMFRRPVDTTEVDDYLEVITNPMDFDKMLYKLDKGEYSSAQSFLDDIDLIAENAIEYNGDPNYETNKVICHRARALQDFAYALVKAEMDTDFEDECKEIVFRRKQLTKKLKETPVQPVPIKHHDPNDVTRSGSKKRPAKKRVSGWARGVDPSRKRKRVNHLENGNAAEKTVNGVSGDEDKEHSNNEMSADEDGSGSEASTVGTIQIDGKKLNAVKKDLMDATSDVPTEKLERIFVTLMSCVNAYKAELDRRQLPEELQAVVKTARGIQREMRETEFYGRAKENK